MLIERLYVNSYCFTVSFSIYLSLKTILKDAFERDTINDMIIRSQSFTVSDSESCSNMLLNILLMLSSQGKTHFPFSSFLMWPDTTNSVRRPRTLSGRATLAHMNVFRTSSCVADVEKTLHRL